MSRTNYVLFRSSASEFPYNVPKTPSVLMCGLRCCKKALLKISFVVKICIRPLIAKFYLNLRHDCEPWPRSQYRLVYSKCISYTSNIWLVYRRNTQYSDIIDRVDPARFFSQNPVGEHRPPRHRKNQKGIQVLRAPSNHHVL